MPPNRWRGEEKEKEVPKMEKKKKKKQEPKETSFVCGGGEELKKLDC